MCDHEVMVPVTEGDRASAERMADARMVEAARRQSPDRPSARNLPAQYRGALGELVAARWFTSLGFEVRHGFASDAWQRPDLTVNDVGVEVMTAQLHHRAATGFCVPPNKLWAARQREAAGYLFVGLDPGDAGVVWLQGWVRERDVDTDEPRLTSVRPEGHSVLNYVVPADLVRPVGDLLADLMVNGEA